MAFFRIDARTVSSGAGSTGDAVEDVIEKEGIAASRPNLVASFPPRVALRLDEQVEIGVDAPDYPTALRAALRQMPDVLIVGEMRDAESMRLALTAAETGHLVISTLHTTDVTSTVARMADSFPVERQATIRQEISLALSAVLIQSLLPRVSGGLVPAVELLMVQYGARQHIRKNQLHHLHQEITLTRRFGSLTFEESLASLVRAGHLDADVARERAAHPEELCRLLESS